MSSELWLSLDLASAIGSLALHRYNGAPELLEEITLTDMQKHSEELLPSIDRICKNQKIEIKDVARFLLPIGPGSFTGLRVGMAAVKALSLVTNAKVETVDGSEIRALHYFKENPTADLVVITTQLATNKKLSLQFKRGEYAPVEGQTDGPTTELLSARLIGEYLLDAKSRKTHQSLEELIALSPIYFGDNYLRRR